MKYTLHTASVKDIDFCDLIHTQNMKPYVEKLYLWKPQLFRNNFIADDYQVIIGGLDILSGILEWPKSENQVVGNAP